MHYGALCIIIIITWTSWLVKQTGPTAVSSESSLLMDSEPTQPLVWICWKHATRGGTDEECWASGRLETSAVEWPVGEEVTPPTIFDKIMFIMCDLGIQWQI